MELVDLMQGQRVKPLAEVVVRRLKGGELIVTDGKGAVYFRSKVDDRATFIVGGALGTHTVRLLDADGNPLDLATIEVEARTDIQDEGGAFNHLLDMLFYTMAAGDGGEARWVHYNGRLYYNFICWLRDHVHVLKGMKYYHDRLRDGIDLYHDSQRADGMIWDNWHKKQPETPDRNHWGARFYYGDFYRDFPDYAHLFTRIPVENDVEYLYIEGIYYTWKAIADDAWMADKLDSAMRALEYSITSPYRWSQKFGLLKRGHTIDTWDFQNEEDCLADFADWPDPMAIHPEKTRFGVMFGDNTGYAVGCEYLAEMLEHVGRHAAAGKYRRRAAEIRQRLDQVSWNGRFFTHHVPEQEGLDRNLGVDETSQVSLSNAYSLNRRISHAQAAAIIRTYLEIRDNLPPGSPGEWYTIYPPFQRGYGGHNSIWQYMNASVTPIVAGELAHGAFQHGFEDYGVDILRRLIALGEKHGGMFHSSYTGAYAPPPQRSFSPLHLAGLANVDTEMQGAPGVPAWTGEGPNALELLPKGEQVFAEVPFRVIDPAQNGRRGCIGLSSRDGYAHQVEIPVSARAGAVYFLHALAHIQPGGVGGKITLNYADGSSFSRYVVDQFNALPWNHWIYLDAPDAGGNDPHCRIAWRTVQPARLNVQLLAYGLNNPHPEKEIASITLTGAAGGVQWFVLGMTLSDQPVYFAPDPISFGIPNGWSAAAVAYAMVEGLAGVVDQATGFDRVDFAPRWVAADLAKAEVCITYPASRGYVAYRYRHDPAQKKLTFLLTGNGRQFDGHVLLPRDTRPVEVRVAGSAVEFTPVKVEQSAYVDFKVPGGQPVLVEVRYQ